MNFSKLVIISSVVTFTACSSHSVKTTETRRTDPYTSETVETKTTEKSESSENDSCSGVLSCTVNFVGDVIAFPFRLVGGLVTAIF